MYRFRQRPGYTLIEILVAVAIIGVLVALTLPAITAVRAAAQRAECVNNLRQLAHAALQFHDKNDRLPEAVLMPYAKPAAPPGKLTMVTQSSGIPPDGLLRDLLGPILDSPSRVASDPRYPFGPNWLVKLLPYLSQAALYEHAGVENYLPGFKSGNASQRDAWRAVVKDKVIPVLRCPSDNPDDGYNGLSAFAGPWARGNYGANAGPGWWPLSLRGFSYEEKDVGITGPVMGINFGVDTAAIPDGASTTVMINELRSGVSKTDARGAWAMGFPGSSVTSSNAIGDCVTPNDRNEGSDDIEDCPKFHYKGIGARDRMGCSTGIANLGWPSWQAQARSMHAEGVHVAFCDGSVKLVSPYIGQLVWFSMLSTSDGVAYVLD